MHKNLIDYIENTKAEFKILAEAVRKDKSLSGIAKKTLIALDQAAEALKGTKNKKEEAEALDWWRSLSLALRKEYARVVIDEGKHFGALVLGEVVACYRWQKAINDNFN